MDSLGRIWRRERDSNFRFVLILNNLFKINAAYYVVDATNAVSLYVYWTRTFLLL
jgi:hypothetical protein